MALRITLPRIIVALTPGKKPEQQASMTIERHNGSFQYADMKQSIYKTITDLTK
jgi:hypothetical protein